MEQSFEEAYRVLKKDRWMTLVFTHKDPNVFDKIVQSAINAGFEFVNAVAQDTRRPSFHKTNNSLTVIKGQMMLNFRKPKVKTSQLSLFDTTNIELEDFIVEEVGYMLEDSPNGIAYSDIVHKIYEKVLAAGFIRNFSRDISCIFSILDEHFYSYRIGNDLIFSVYEPPRNGSSLSEAV